MPLFQSIYKINDPDLSFQENILALFKNITTTEDYIIKVFQLAAFTILRDEILESYNSLISIYPYGFAYRFYHLKVSQYETTAFTADPDYQLKKTKYSDKIQKLRTKYLDGVYNIPIEIIKNEIPDSITATNRINGMMPIKAQEYFSYYKSPFVSADISVMNPEIRKELPRKVRKAYGTDILTVTIDKPYIDSIIAFIEPFNYEILNIIKDTFKSKFGEVNTDSLTQTNLRDYLLLLQP